jgi:hypothetical protein
LTHLAHESDELRVDCLEATELLGELLLDISTAEEDALQVDPPPLHVNPHVEYHTQLGEAISPGASLVRKDLVVRGVGHR